VINADDFYGAGAYRTAADYLAKAAGRGGDDYFMVGYYLRKTVSPHGPVSRGVCSIDAEGFLTDVTEVVGISVDGAGMISAGPEDALWQFTGSEIVSMNMWGFRPSLFGHLERLFTRFLSEHGSSATAEFYIPAAVATLIRENAARVKVLSTDAGEWVGATYAQDKPVVMEQIRGLVEAGVYPAPLWPAG